MLLTSELGPDGDVEFTQIADFVTPGPHGLRRRPLPDIVLFGSSIPTEKFSEASAFLQSHWRSSSSPDPQGSVSIPASDCSTASKRRLPCGDRETAVSPRVIRAATKAMFDVGTSDSPNSRLVPTV
jgi:hypothetical protein